MEPRMHQPASRGFLDEDCHIVCSRDYAFQFRSALSLLPHPVPGCKYANLSFSDLIQFYSLRFNLQVDFDEELGERLVSKQIAYRWELDNEDQRFIKTPDIFRCYSNLDPMPIGIPLEVIITAVETPSEVYLQCPVLPHQLGALCSQYPAHKTWFQAASEAYESLSTTGRLLPSSCFW